MSLRRVCDVVLLVALGVGAFVYRAQLSTVAAQIQQRIAPCSRPVTYTIGTIDPRFGITREEFLADAKKAADIWNAGSGRVLLAYDQTNGDVKVNFVYDTRQETTQELGTIDASMSARLASYKVQKARYDAQTREYDTKKAAFLALQSRYDAELAAYNAEVLSWNNRGGAPPAALAGLNAKKANLETLSQQVQSALAAANAAARLSNAMMTDLNAMVSGHNAEAATYNTLNKTLGDEFEEGLFESSGWEEHIDVYQYKDTHTLVRLLAHEMGHALRLDHVDDPQAIMYYLNDSSREDLTTDDLSALHAKCGR